MGRKPLFSEEQLAKREEETLWSIWYSHCLGFAFSEEDGKSHLLPEILKQEKTFAFWSPKHKNYFYTPFGPNIIKRKKPDSPESPELPDIYIPEKAVKQTFYKSKMGDGPMFGINRDKIGNVIARIVNPYVRMYDFDNHNYSPILQEMVSLFLKNPFVGEDIVYGTREDNNGLHLLVKIGSPVEKQVVKFAKHFYKSGGHIDIFDANIKRGVGIPGLDHYKYDEQQICMFIAGVEAKNHTQRETVTVEEIKVAEEIFGKPTSQTKKTIKKLPIEEIRKITQVEKPISFEEPTLQLDEDITTPISFKKGNRYNFLLSGEGHSFVSQLLKKHNNNIEESLSQIKPILDKDHITLFKKNAEWVQKTNKNIDLLDNLSERQQRHILSNRSKTRQFILKFIISCMNNKKTNPYLVYEYAAKHIDTTPDNFYKQFRILIKKYKIQTTHPLYFKNHKQDNMAREIINYGTLQNISIKDKEETNNNGTSAEIYSPIFLNNIHLNITPEREIINLFEEICNINGPNHIWLSS